MFDFHHTAEWKQMPIIFLTASWAILPESTTRIAHGIELVARQTTLSRNISSIPPQNMRNSSKAKHPSEVLDLPTPWANLGLPII